MLVYFSAANFRSINQPIELNLQAAPRLRRLNKHVLQPSENNKLKILKSAVIYGANASGKSNIIKALEFAQDLIISPQSSNKSIKAEPFLFDNHNQSKSKNESSFYFEFVVKKQHFGLGIKYNSQKIIEESLYLFNGDNQTCLYQRTTDDNLEVTINGNIIDSWPQQYCEYLQEFKFIAKYTPAKGLFITEVKEKSLVSKLAKYNSQLNLLTSCYDFFNNQLIIIYPHTKYADLLTLTNNQTINTMLSGLDTSIDSIESTPVDASQLPEHLIMDLDSQYPVTYKNQRFQARKNEQNQLEIFHIYAKHSTTANKQIRLELEQESDGTKRLIDLIAVLKPKTPTSSATTYIIDEFDRSLHPNLAKKFLELFLNHNNQSQLIVTTHQGELLDNQLLRRDEIWFVQKEWDQSTRLYSLNDYSTRFDKDIHKAYLQGKFGAVPIISDEIGQLSTTSEIEKEK